MLLALTLLSACVRDAPLPDVGDCAVYPEGVYDYGQIGIGTCLAGPTELAWMGAESDDPDDWVLLATNANPYQDFTGGSLLALPWSDLDLSQGRNVISNTGAVALDLPDFAGGLAIVDDLALVGVRYSEDSRTRVDDDLVWLVDVSDPLGPVLSDRGTDGGSTVQVQADPIDVVYDPGTGLAFTANRSAHTISVLDPAADPVAVVPPWPEYAVNASDFDDADLSGSRARMVELDVADGDLITDDNWTLTWVDGNWRIWVPGDDGLYRLNTVGNGVHTYSGLGVELSADDSAGVVQTIEDPSYFPSDPARMAFADSGGIRAAQTTDDTLEDWAFESDTLLAGRSNSWDVSLGGPDLISDGDLIYLFYDALDADGASAGIGLGTSSDGVEFERDDVPLFVGEQAHDAEGVFDPTVFWDNETQLWRMYYSAWDGAVWTIGHASSPDLVTWTPDATPVLALDTDGAAAPAVRHEVGAWRMWYARWDGAGWSLAEAWSTDGTHWEDLGIVDAIDQVEPDELAPPGPAAHGAATSAWQVRGEDAGLQFGDLEPDTAYASATYGWTVSTASGYWLGETDAGSDSAGGIRLDAMDRDAGLAWLTLTDEGGTRRIGLADLDADGTPTARSGAVLEGSSAFGSDGLRSPAVIQASDGTWVMFVAGADGGTTSVGRATSPDGVTWTLQGEVLAVGEDWDSISVIPGNVQPVDGGWRLWYTGSNGTDTRIGAAFSDDEGQTWTRETATRDWVFAPGAPGEWDDSGVSDPYVLSDDDGDHLWYAGYDGDLWRVGHAFRAADGDLDDWERSKDAEGDETRPAIPLTGGLFHPDGLRRPVILPETDAEGRDGYVAWFTGLFDDERRVGRAWGLDVDRFNKTPLRPTVGDSIGFTTQKGDADAVSIDLDVTVDGLSLVGIGLTALDIDTERGFLYATSKLTPYVFVIDIRDDTDEDNGVTDLNYLDIEAVLYASTASGAQGFRQVVPVPGRDLLYALNDSPEAVYVLDLSELVDDDYADNIRFTPLGWLGAPRGALDEGVTTRSSVGPAQLVVHPDGERLFVTNFNANSIGVYDLELGPYGTLIEEITLVGENPYALLLTPDGRHAVFANYLGEVEDEGPTSSTLGILDIDETSPTYLQVVSWVVNQ